ncbi:long-chain-fatty-acid--CoA ligase [Brevibacterium ihuae]|uniref:long-chain-fatty-acid--CoA ligase n=1 Tax=Brevibacterium ihuae TaxID=1631743 RepID=UPI001FE83A1B|nr:long-chain-fatty-acid--CoA ligase [Brevibacterium ihuae]
MAAAEQLDVNPVETADVSVAEPGDATGRSARVESAGQVWNTELTPLSFLRRSADVFPHKRALVYGSESLTYAEFAAAVEQRAHALRAAGVEPSDRVAYLVPNLPEMLIAQFAVPLAGAVLVSINTRLAAEEVRYICDHSQARLLVVDAELWPTVAPVADALDTVERIVVAEDPLLAAGTAADANEEDTAGEAADDAARTSGTDAGPARTSGTDAAAEALAHPATVSLAEFLAGADAHTAALPWTVDDENATLSINYTSGTTGQPKGVMYTHRGAYLNAMSEIIHSRHDNASVYLWTLPMFHCNGWCTGWAVAAAGGTQVCLREVRAEVIWGLIDREGVTHLNGAPTVMTTLVNAPEAHALDRTIIATVAGAPPSPTIIWQLEELGFRIVHVYGLTETYGPHTVCEWQEEWDGYDRRSRARVQSRQGVGMLHTDPIRVVAVGGGDELTDVPADGRTIGEIVMRGNNVMKGYFRNPEATAKAFAGGWFHSGDLGVMHPDGYIELRDRAKDIIVSGGENISTVEVEQAIVAHEAVLEAAVIGVPDEKWGERPKAYVVLRAGEELGAEELLDHVRSLLARYKTPREVEFVDALAKSSTGKIQKFELREAAWAGHASRIQG